ncbi:MAG TPA: hypothetical protein VII73_13875 [Caulobacteraceae bacterium]
MQDNKTDGAENVVLGKFEAAAGEALGDGEMQLRGAGRQAGGYIQEAAETVQDALSEVADRARAVAARASQAYGQVSDAAQGIAGRIDPFVEERPYLAVGLGAAVGLLVGLLIAGRGPKIIYVKPRN